MRTIHATAEQVEALLAADDGGPVAIVNLLKFKPLADYPGRPAIRSDRAIGTRSESTAFRT